MAPPLKTDKNRSGTSTPDISDGAAGWWSHVEHGPPDSIGWVIEAFRKNTSPSKINLGIGAYRDDNGQPFILPSVQMAEEIIHKQRLDKEYGPRCGLTDFNSAAAKLAFGHDSAIIQNGLNVTVQAISGTGALHLGAAWLEEFFLGNKEVYVPSPTWANHRPVFEHAGLPVKEYRYYNTKTCNFDFDGAMQDFRNLPLRSVVLLQACAHNPTGADPTPSQWAAISEVLKAREALVFFDMAYQGFASGCPDRDALAVRMLVQDGHKILLAQSFAKNMGLYGERVGAFTVICDNKEEARAVESQVELIIRPVYSTPPVHGARLVATILNTPELHAQWLLDIRVMANRIIRMRQLLVEQLTAEGSCHPWHHITNQIGMFCYSGLTPQQVDRLLKEYNVYLTRDGRISMAGVTAKNVKYLANAIHLVTKSE